MEPTATPADIQTAPPPAMSAQSQLLLIVCGIALVHSAWEYFSGELNGLRFILAITDQPLARIWPVVYVIPFIQIAAAIVGIAKLRSPRVVWWSALVCIGCALAIQSFVLTAQTLLRFDEKVTQKGLASAWAPSVGLLFVSILVWLFWIRRHPIESFQFSLRTLLIVLTLAAVLFGLFAVLR